MNRLLNTVLLVLAISLTSQAQATTFKIATIAPDGTSWMNAMRTGAKEVQERTEGRVTFRFYPGGIMGNDKSVLRKIRVGQLHGGALTGGGLADILPEIQVYNLPFLFRDFDEVDYVRQKMDPLLLRGLEKEGYVTFGISEGGFAYLMSNSAISGIDNLKGHKVWVPQGDAISRAAFEATGISPISLPLTDVLTGLQTGLIDTVASTPIGAIALQWHTRVQYITDTPLMYIYGALVLKRRAFEKLSEKDQRVVRDVMIEVFKRLNSQNRDDNTKARQALQNQGIEFVSSEAKEIRHWRSVIGTSMDELVKNGLFEPAIQQQLLKHLETYRARAATD